MKWLAMTVVLQLARKISGEKVCSGQACLDPSTKTIIVREGQPIEIKFESEGIYPCDPDPDDCDFDKITVDLGTHSSGCTLKFNRETPRMDRDDLTPSSNCQNTRDSSWAATANDFPSSSDVFLKIDSAHPDDSGQWKFEVKPSSSQDEAVVVFPDIWVIAEPLEVSFVKENGDDNEDYNDGEVELDPRNNDTEYVFCKATKVRPAPQFIWTVEIDSVPVEINNIPELENATILNAANSSWENSDFPNQYLDVTSQLELPIIGWLDTKTLGCRIEIHDTNGINLTPPAAKLSRNVTFTVPAAPVPSTDPEINPEGTFVAGEQGVLVVHFHSNPEPDQLYWQPWDVSSNLTSNRTNMTVQYGRYTSEGWMDAVDCLSNHTACAGIQSLANPRNAYVAILTISELSEDDQNNAHSLFIKNTYGTTTYSVRIQNMEVGLTTGAIAGIVVGCIVGVVLIAAAVLMFIRHRNGKKSKKIRQRKKESRAEERTDRL